MTRTLHAGPSRPACLALFAVVAALAGACGPGTRSRETTIDVLRRRAAAAPDDAAAWTALAEGELLGWGGDPIRARAAAAHALRLRPGDPTLHLIAALERDLHGETPEALAAYLATLEAAVAATGQGEDRDRRLAGAIAEAAVGAIRGLEDEAPGWAAAVGPALERAAAAPALPFPVQQGVGDLRARLALRAGDPAEARALAAAQGCVTDWRVAGPFGPRELLGFDAPPAAVRDALAAPSLPGSVDLGRGRGVRPTREHRSRACAVHLGSDVVQAGGTTIAEARLDVAEGGPRLLRLESPNAFRARVDGRLVLAVDRLRETGPSLHFAEVDLAPGAHVLTVEIVTRHPNPVLLAAVSAPGAASVRLPPADGTHVDAFLRASIAYGRGDVVEARETLRPYARGRDDEGEASPLLLSLAASVTLADPLRPADVKRDAARTLLRAARRDPGAWAPVLQGAALAAADGQDLEAIGVLREAAARWPNRPSVAMALVDLLLGRGWDAEAGEVIEVARARVPDSCAVLQSALAVEQRRDRIDAKEALTEALADCDRGSNVRFRQLVDARRWDEAAAELERLAAYEPPQDREVVLRAQLDLARARGDEAAADQLVASLREEAPRDAYLARAQVDAALARGEREQALRQLDEELARDPAAMGPLFSVRRALGGDDLTPWRLDGREAIRAFEASGRTYDAPQVLVLDYQVVRVHEDGAARSLVHQITRIQSEEAVDDLGEFAVPDGADLLTLRTIKADGSVLEPDAIAGKSTVSLPNLAVGDYVEHEHVTVLSPSATFPDGFLGGRFYFKSFEVPFDRSELVLLAPTDRAPTVEPRGNAPVLMERREGALAVYRWLVEGSRPLVPEPLAVNAREFIPSIQFGIDTRWEDWVESLVDALVDKDPRDPEAVRLVATILGDDADAPPEVRAAKLHAWVSDEIEPLDEAFGLAPAMLAERTGDPTRVLHYLLGLAGVRSQLVLAKSLEADQQPSALPDGESFRHLVLRLPDLDPPTVLVAAGKWVPFAYVPAVFRGQEALVLAPGPLERVGLPSLPAEVDARHIAVEARLREDGSAHLRVVERNGGVHAQSWREALESLAPALRDQRFEEAYVSQLVPGAELAELAVVGERDREAPLELRYLFDVSRLGRPTGPLWLVPGLFPSRVAPVYAAAGRRTTAELVPAPIDVTVDVRIVPPEGAPPPSARAPVVLEGPGGARFELREAREPDALVVHRRLVIPSMRVEVADYAAFAAFLRAVDEAEARETPFTIRPARFDRLDPSAATGG